MSKQSGTPFTLTPQVAESAAALARLIAAVYSVPGSDPGRKALVDSDLAQRLRAPVTAEMSLADWALVRLAADETLSSYQYGMLDTAERVVTGFLSTPAFHPQLAITITTLRGIFVGAALPADGWLTNPQHPARQVLSLLYALACGWQPESGAAATTLRNDIGNWLTTLLRSPNAWQEVADAMRATQDAERSRLERVEKRLIESESGVLRARRARQVAARTLNQSFAGRPIGTEVAEALHQIWLPAMQWTVLHEGEQGPLWQRSKRVTGTLRWTLSPEMGEDAQHQLMRLIGQATDELTALAPAVIHDAAARERLLEILGQEHVRVLRNEPRETQPFTPAESHDALADASASLSETLLTQVRALQPGQWILLREGNNTQRARLLLKQDDSRQLLFVNALGQKTLQPSWETLALQMTRGDLEALPLTAPLADCIATVLAELAKRHEQSQQSRLETLRAAREQAAAEARLREQARQKALAEAQTLENARHDAMRRAAELDAAAGVQASDASQQQMQRARLQASSLTIGVWLLFRSGETAERRKLAVLLPSNGKYIFVNADGTGKLELLRDELVRGLADGSIEALQKDQRLDDALTRVVDSLRHERGTGGS